MTEIAVEVRGVERVFGEVKALTGLDLAIERGIVFGLLGPNGAGKTTLVKILATLLAPSGGSASVFGFDVTRDPLAVRRRIGLAGQFAAVDNELTGRENLEMVGRLTRLSRSEARRRAGEALERYRLLDAGDRRVSTYSGGMRRRLDLAAGLIARPPLVLLDEPTTGLDPRSRQELWGAIDELRREGTTVLLTTQYLEEADRLAQRIAVIDRGSIAAEGSPAELKNQIGGNVLTVHLTEGGDLASAAALLGELTDDGRPTIEEAVGEIRLPIADPAISAAALRALDARGIAVASIELHRPSLDDVFLALTGRPAEPSTETRQEELV
jgi:ABC-2 type transport system ATP-binding protein